MGAGSPSRRLALAVSACAALAAAAAIGCGNGQENGEEEPQRPPVVAVPPGNGGDTADGDARPGQSIPTGDGRGGVRLELVGEFDQPVFVSQPRAERHDLYVVEQCGRIMRVTRGVPARQPFLDIGELVTCGGEQGLLSVAFAPDYRRSGRFYVDYTDTAGDTRVVEYRRSASNPEVADPDSARELLFVDQPYANHNGGLLLFGPDDLLYVGLGDGGSGGDPMRVGQDLASLLGKILRIDPRPPGGEPYAVPRSNPFVDEAGARPEVFAYGLRNPWRFSFDRFSGDLWIGDVGQSEAEEVDAVAPAEAAGANFGWSAFEGDVRYNTDQEAPGHVTPVLTYPLEGDNCSVTGGYVVRDPALESVYGRYLYGDYCAGELRSFVARPGRPAAGDTPLGLEVPQLSSFGEDSAGHVYAVSLAGPVYRLTPEAEE